MSIVLVSEADGVGRITLNRPDAMNAITTALAAALRDALADLGERARVIVIDGAGGNFCAGGDFKALQAIREDPVALRELFETFHAACGLIGELPVPVIAAVEGNAMAGGFELMLASDFAIVREDARIGDNHSNYAMVPGGGSTQRLPRLVGRQRALGLILSGDRISGRQAAEWGLAYQALAAEEFQPAVDAMAQRLAAKDPAALARTKATVRAGLERPLSEGIEVELAAVLAHLQGDDAMAAFTSKGDA
jgi:enoyl-CoA hydratase/carnithine racemase